MDESQPCLMTKRCITQLVQVLSRVYARGRRIAVLQDEFPCNFDAIDDAVGVMTPRRGTPLVPCQVFVFPRICTLLYARLASSLYNIRVRPDHT